MNIIKTVIDVSDRTEIINEINQLFKSLSEVDNTIVALPITVIKKEFSIKATDIQVMQMLISIGGNIATEKNKYFLVGWKGRTNFHPKSHVIGNR